MRCEQGKQQASSKKEYGGVNFSVVMIGFELIAGLFFHTHSMGEERAKICATPFFSAFYSVE